METEPEPEPQLNTRMIDSTESGVLWSPAAPLTVQKMVGGLGGGTYPITWSTICVHYARVGRYLIHRQ